jgi:hypothetical protein
MVVEDDRIVAADIRHSLRDLGYDVLDVVDSGEEAVELAARRRPDLVLMDVHLRGILNGVDAARSIRQQLDLPIVYLTAYTDDATLEAARKTEPYGFIVKPFREHELRSAIEVALYKHRMERKLRESEEWYRRLFEDDLVGRFVASGDGRLVVCNRAFRSLLGIASTESVVARRIDDLFANGGVGTRLLAEVRRSGKIEGRELRLNRRDAEAVHVLANLTATLDETDQPVQIRGDVLDISERKQLEQRMIEAQRMEALGRLASGISHDFNNVLTAILGYVDLLEESVVETRPRGGLEQIRRLTEEAGSLTSQLLAYGRRQPSKTAVFDLNDFLRGGEDLVRRLLGEDVRLVLDLPPRVDPIECDPDQFQQVLLNLILNARDAMPEGGTATISSARTVEEGSETFDGDSLEPGTFVVLRVADTGCGMVRETCQRVFEPYFTTKPRGHGTGLGLAAAYGIVRSRGGLIRVRSEPGRGSTFEVVLPLASGPPTRLGSEDEMRSDEAPAPAASRLLIVEDRREIRVLAQRVIARQGYEVWVAADGAEALARAAEIPGGPDLVVTDVVLPDVSGWEVVERLRAEYPDMKAVFMSGYSEEDLAKKLGSGRVSSFIQKPFRSEQLLAVVRQALRSREPG